MLQYLINLENRLKSIRKNCCIEDIIMELIFKIKNQIISTITKGKQE
jgi:hypothetical protein